MFDDVAVVVDVDVDVVVVVIVIVVVVVSIIIIIIIIVVVTASSLLSLQWIHNLIMKKNIKRTRSTTYYTSQQSTHSFNFFKNIYTLLRLSCRRSLYSRVRVFL